MTPTNNARRDLCGKVTGVKEPFTERSFHGEIERATRFLRRLEAVLRFNQLWTAAGTIIQR